MGRAAARFMRPDDWRPAPIARGRYFNAAPLTGYRRTDGTGGNPLYPSLPPDDFESRLADEMRRVRSLFPPLELARYHVQMPYWPPDDERLPTRYRFVPAPQRLTTTSVTAALLPQAAIAAGLGFCFAGDVLPPLRARLRGTPFHGLIGNLGYYMTADLLGEKFPWSHSARYPRFPLPPLRSYIGFHLFRAADGEACAGFQGAHPAAVAVRRNGMVEILPRLEISGYRVGLAGREFTVHSINAPAERDGVMLFTPGLRTPEMRAHEEDWRTYAPLLPLAGRVNLFIANEGDGRQPVEKVAAVWESKCPLPSFGALLSFDSHLLSAREGRALVGQRVRVQPLGGSDLSPYVQVMGGLVPLVIGGEHVYCVETVAQLRERLREHGNALSPIARSGRESDNLAPRVREPAGVLVQTTERVGWVLFDGRHELSLGAGVADAARILRLLEEAGAFGGDIEQAVFIDGGSALKVYGVESDGEQVDLHLLNRVAAGSRNGPSADGEGLNLYSVLRVGIIT